MPEATMTNKMNWDLSSYFPEFSGPEMRDFKDRLKKDIESIKEKAASLSSLDDSNKTDWKEVFLKNEDILKALLASKLIC